MDAIGCFATHKRELIIQMGNISLVDWHLKPKMYVVEGLHSIKERRVGGQQKNQSTDRGDE